MASTPRVYKTEAIVIHHHEIGEADRIITLYSPYLGKLKAIAKGVRRPRSKMGGHLELLNQSQLLVARGQGLDIITQAQLLESFMPLRRDLWRLSCGLYAAELADLFTPERLPNSSLYQLLLNTLHRLGKVDKSDVILRFYEMRLLDLAGYRPQLHRCSQCNANLEPGSHYFSSPSGGLVCPRCRAVPPLPISNPISTNAVKVLRTFQNSPYEMAIRLRLNHELSLELEYILRSFINYVLEQKVKSTTWLDHLRRQAIPSSLPGTIT